MSDDMKKEREEGLDFEYLKDALIKKKEVGDRYFTPPSGITAQLFCSMAKIIFEKLGEEEGERIIKEAVEYFGYQRGKRIADTVTALGLPLTFKNWIIYTDIATTTESRFTPKIEDGDLIVETRACDFFQGGEKWDLRKYAYYYCKYVDEAILRGYNPDMKLIVSKRLTAGDDSCTLRYITKDANK
jgi:hypothetical protein